MGRVLNYELMVFRLEEGKYQRMRIVVQKTPYNPTLGRYTAEWVNVESLS